MAIDPPLSTTGAGLSRGSPRLPAIGLGRRAARGDRSAFEQIFRRYHQDLYRYCLTILRNPEDAEDALQATMAAALRSLPGEERPVQVRAWLFRVAHNESISLLRDRRTVPLEEDHAAGPEGRSHDAEIGTRERLRRLVGDLRELPDRQRSAVVMRELSGLSYTEIAMALTCTEGGARQAVYEGRTALREREEGREMQCEEACRAISDHDRRRLRGRKLGAHLRACATCRGFAASLDQRRSDLQALSTPLAAGSAGAMLTGLLGGSAGGGAAGSVGGLAAASGLATSAAVKGASVMAAAAVAVGAADVGGAIDLPNLPNPIGGDARSVPAPAQAPSPTADESEPPIAGETASHSLGQRTEGAGAEGGGTPSDPGVGGSRPETGDARGVEGGVKPAESAAGSPAASTDAEADAAGGSASGGSNAEAPGQTGTSNGGGSADAPGQTGLLPGNATEAPGHAAVPPGNSATAPGHDDTKTSPGLESGQGALNNNASQTKSSK